MDTNASSEFREGTMYIDNTVRLLFAIALCSRKKISTFASLPTCIIRKKSPFLRVLDKENHRMYVYLRLREMDLPMAPGKKMEENQVEITHGGNFFLLLANMSYLSKLSWICQF